MPSIDKSHSIIKDKGLKWSHKNLKDIVNKAEEKRHTPY